LEDAVRAYREAARTDPESPLYPTSLGLLLGFKKGDWEGALVAYQEAVDRDPESADAVSGLGNALRELGRWKEALPYLRRAVELSPQEATLVYNLGVGLYSAGDARGAEAKYREAIALDPRHAQARNNLGSVLLERDDVAGGLEQLRVAVELEPDNAMWLTNLATAYDRDGQAEKALETYRRALDVDAEGGLAQSGIGVHFMRHGQAGDALPYLEQAVALGGGIGLRHLNLGLAYEMLERLDEAIASFRAATAAARPAEAAWGNLAYALARRDGPGAAIEPFQKAIAHEPKNAQYRLDLGHCYSRVRDFRRAAEAYRAAVELGHPDGYLYLTQTLYGPLHDPQGAFTAFEEWIRAQPENPIARYNFGMLFTDLQRFEDARRCFAEAARLDPKSSHAQCNLGLALYALGRKDEAVAELKKALAIDPDLREGHNALGYYYRHEAKQPEKALVHFRNLARNQKNNFECQWLLAEVLLETGRAAEAAEQWGIALALCPNHDGNHDRAARALLAFAGLPEAARLRAVEFAQRAVELEPDEARYRETLAAAQRPGK